MTRRGNPAIQFHEAWNQAMRLNQHTRITCGLCDQFDETGCLYHVRRAHQHHRAKHHPEARSSRRPRTGPSPVMVGSRTLDENIANARAKGAATWEGAAA